MSRDSTVIAFRQPEAIDDPLSEIAREGARRMLAQVLVAEADSFVTRVEGLEIAGWPPRSYIMAMGRIAKSRPGLGLLRSAAPRCAIGATWALGRKSAR